MTKNIYVYCEGQTEESFVKYILIPYFIPKEIFLNPIICRTKEGPSGIHRGGITSYAKVVKELKKLCQQHPNEKVTSFIDYYGLENIPNVEADTRDIYEKITLIEDRLYEDVGFSNFISHLSLHEFESLLFSNPQEFEYISSRRTINNLENILNQYNNNPELINNSKETAPSKRILNEIPDYSKVLNGISIATKITLPVMISKCKHFAEWIYKLERI